MIRIGSLKVIRRRPSSIILAAAAARFSCLVKQICDRLVIVCDKHPERMGRRWINRSNITYGVFSYL